MGSKEQLAADTTVKALTAAHEETKGKIVFVTSEFGSENAEALVDFFEVDPKSKDVQVCVIAVEKLSLRNLSVIFCLSKLDVYFGLSTCTRNHVAG